MALAPAREADMRRGQTALAHHMAAYLRLQVIRQQNLREAHRVELAPISLATWSAFLQLRSLPMLRMEAGFPCTLRWLDAMCDQSVQIIGQTCMAEHLNASLSLTVTERAEAAQQRSTIIVELNNFPTWVEARAEQMPPSLRLVLERYLNSASELFWELSQAIPDKALVQVAERCAEAILRCRLRRSPGSGEPTVPVGPPPRPSSAPRDRMVAYGFAAPADPNLVMVTSDTGGAPVADGSTLTPAAAAPAGSPPGRDGDSGSDDSVVIDDDAWSLTTMTLMATTTLTASTMVAGLRAVVTMLLMDDPWIVADLVKPANSCHLALQDSG